MVADPSVSLATDGQAVWMLIRLRSIMGPVHKMDEIAHLQRVVRFTCHCASCRICFIFDRILAVMEVFYVHRFLVLYQVMHIRSGDAISSSPKVLWISTPHDVDARGLGGLVGTGGMLYTTFLLSEALWRTVTRHNTYVRREGSRYRRI